MLYANHLLLFIAFIPPNCPGRLVFIVDAAVCAHISPSGLRHSFFQPLGILPADNSRSNSSPRITPTRWKRSGLPKVTHSLQRGSLHPMPGPAISPPGGTTVQPCWLRVGDDNGISWGLCYNSSVPPSASFSPQQICMQISSPESDSLGNLTDHRAIRSTQHQWNQKLREVVWFA